MKIQSLLLFLLAVLTTSIFAQEERDAFDKYGPPGEIYTNLKDALKDPKIVYKLKLEYQAIDPKLQPKITKLTEVQVLQMTANNLTQLPARDYIVSKLILFCLHWK